MWRIQPWWPCNLSVVLMRVYASCMSYDMMDMQHACHSCYLSSLEPRQLCSVCIWFICLWYFLFLDNNIHSYDASARRVEILFWDLHDNSKISFVLAIHNPCGQGKYLEKYSLITSCPLVNTHYKKWSLLYFLRVVF